MDTGSSPSVQYTYDDGGGEYVRLTNVTYPDGRSVGYDYASGVDEIMSRVSSIFEDDDADGVLDGGEDINASYKYLGAGAIIEEDYEDIAVKLSYLDSNGDITGLDRFGRVVEQVWTDYGADPDEILDHYSFTYDRAGNRVSKSNELHAAFDEIYEYDNLDRLRSSERADDYDQTWTLDGLGNFIAFNDDGDSQNRWMNAANEIESITGSWVTPDYDAAGNIIYGPQSGDETTGLHYVYDAWNRQVSAYEDDGDGTFEPATDDDLIATYEYDGQKCRIEKTLADDTSVEYFYNQGWQLLEEQFIDEYDATTAVNQYIWSQRYIDAPIVRFHDGNADGDCDPTTDANDLIRYYATDANFNITTTITNGYSSDVTLHYVYSAYGEATVYDDNWSNSAAPSESGPLYCGYFFDIDTLNYHVRNRMYNTSLATWLSRDPIGYNAGDANLYRYVGGAPVRFVDPTGLYCGECTPPVPPAKNEYNKEIAGVHITSGAANPGTLSTLFSLQGKINTLAMLNDLSSILTAMGQGAVDTLSEIMSQGASSGADLKGLVPGKIDQLMKAWQNHIGYGVYFEVSYRSCEECTSWNPFMWGGCPEYEWENHTMYYRCTEGGSAFGDGQGIYGGMYNYQPSEENLKECMKKALQ